VPRALAEDVDEILATYLGRANSLENEAFTHDGMLDASEGRDGAVPG
jgi:hypothetical protein